MLSETMAQYSALMVMNGVRARPDAAVPAVRVGPVPARPRIEREKEVPLARVEKQGYIHYNKGSLVMYALQDYLGEESLNRAIAEYLRTVAYQDPPYTNSLEFIESIRRATPPELRI